MKQLNINLHFKITDEDFVIGTGKEIANYILDTIWDVVYEAGLEPYDYPSYDVEEVEVNASE